MTIIVGNTERSELNAAVARARAHPVPWEVLVGSVSRTSRINRSQMSPRRLNSSICPSAMSSPSTSKRNGGDVLAHIGFGSVAESRAEYGRLRDDL
jgi:hypothetical protein